MTGHLYVCEFSTGVIKVGRSGAAEKRLSSHRSVAKRLGAELLRGHVATTVGDAAAGERELIGRCAGAGTKVGKEWFSGLDFDAVCTWADEIARAPAAPARYRFVLRRDSYPVVGYICRACCVTHQGPDAFLCSKCHDVGYLFHGKAGLTRKGEPVPLWSAVPFRDVEIREVDCVACEELRPDVPWLRIADPEWPMGRPVIDTVKSHPAPTREAA